MPLRSVAQLGTSRRFRTDYQKSADDDNVGFWDENGTITAITAVPSWGCAVQPAVGYSDYARTTRSIRCTRLQWRGYPQQNLSNANGYIFPAKCRLIVYIDKAQNGILPTGANATRLLNYANELGNGALYTFYNPNTVPARYEIIADRFYTLPPLRGTGSGVGYAGSIYDAQLPAGAGLIGYEDYKDTVLHWLENSVDVEIDVTTTFKAAQVPQTNGVNWVLITDPSNGWDIIWVSRCTYEEID